MVRMARAILTAVVALTPTTVAVAGQAVEVLATSGCGCCVGWTRHLGTKGYSPEIRHLPAGEFWQRKMQLGLHEGLTSCHTALIDGYIIEGHVPAREIDRLLSERPKAVGLVVPDMPAGSPGMGEGGGDAEPYQVLLLQRDGTTQVFATYP